MDLFILVATVLGGLALFLFGINLMSAGLRHAFGDHLRVMLKKATRNRAAGLGLGSVIGLMIQSSAGTVMLVGLIHAGLMTLMQSAPVIFGINIGTTLSMQLISFKLGDYCFALIAMGFLLSMTVPGSKRRAAGRALLGFGLLFLGMQVMSDAVHPYRDALAPYLAQADGSTLRGALTGVLIAAGITGIIQSSGATIGMVFAMISAGVITDLRGAYPIIIGANIGTCVTALLGSIGAHIDARRAAISHLLFNILSAALAVATAPVFYQLIPLTSGDLVHQAANANTAKMVFSALILLPFAQWHTKIVARLIPARHPPPEPSHLDEELLDRPERVVAAAIAELRRVGNLCLQSLRLNAEYMLKHNGSALRRIKKNEDAVDEIKVAMREYLTDATHRYLSKRQSILLQHLNRCMAEMERIGDHIDAMCDISVRKRAIPSARFDKQLVEDWFKLFEATVEVIRQVDASLDPEREHFQSMASQVLKARDDYMKLSIEVKSDLMNRMEKKEIAPIAGIYFNDYLSAFDKIIKHARAVALAEQQPEFWIKRKKLHRVVEESEAPQAPDEVDAEDFLDRLQREDYL